MDLPDVLECFDESLFQDNHDHAWLLGENDKLRAQVLVLDYYKNRVGQLEQENKTMQNHYEGMIQKLHDKYEEENKTMQNHYEGVVNKLEKDHRYYKGTIQKLQDKCEQLEGDFKKQRQDWTMKITSLLASKKKLEITMAIDSKEKALREMDGQRMHDHIKRTEAQLKDLIATALQDPKDADKKSPMMEKLVPKSVDVKISLLDREVRHLSDTLLMTWQGNVELMRYFMKMRDDFYALLTSSED